MAIDASITRRTGHELAAGLRAGEYTSAELTEVHLAAAERDNRGLHAWLTIDRAFALRQAETADAALAAARRSGPAALSALPPLHGLPVALKDLVSVEGGQCTAGSRILEGYRAPVRRPHHRAAADRRGGDPGQDEHGRVRDGQLDRAFGLRPDGQPVGSRPGAGRLERRVGHGGRRVPCPVQHRHRHRRLDPPAGCPDRDRRPQADLRPGQPLRDRGLRQLARPDRPVRPRRP